MSRLLFSAIVMATVPLSAPAAPTGGPCSPDATCAAKGPEAMRLQAAWQADATTDEQRERIVQAVAAHRTQSGVDYAAAAKEYFAWRIGNSNYDPSRLAMSPEDSARIASERRSHYRRMRVAAEAAVKSRLLDPSSAEFTWQKGFTAGQWKPFLQRRVSGDIACGLVNARNRMGGYVGASAFVVVLNNETPIFVDMDSGTDRLNLIAAACQKSAFPPPQAGMLDTERTVAGPTPSGGSVADELSKLAKLREQGVLSEDEFARQKAKLLQ